MTALQIEDYRAAVAILEHRHFGRAAAAIGVTQPSLTSRLKRMEDRLGARLFERSRRGVEPTAVGLTFLEAAQDVLRTAESAETVIKDAANGFGQVLRVGFTQLAAQTVVVDALSAFRAHHPRVRLRAVEASTAKLEDALKNHALDVGFLHPPLQTPGLRMRVIRKSAGRVVRLHPEGAPDGFIGYPQIDAPILMTDLAEELAEPERGAQMQNVATTVVGALVLSKSGYGDAIVPVDFEHPLIADAANRVERPVATVLQTAVAARAGDRRAIVRDLFAAATASAVSK